MFSFRCDGANPTCTLRQGIAATSGSVVFTRVRLVGAVAALIAAVSGATVGWQRIPAAPTAVKSVELRSTAAPMETTIQGHRAAAYWVLKPTYHNSYWYFSCMVAFKTSYGVPQQALDYSTVYSNPEVDCPSTNLQRANDLASYYKF
jgi:hypothetical protein